MHLTKTIYLLPLCPQVHLKAQVVNTLVKTSRTSRQTSCCPPSAASRAATSGSSTSATTYLMGILWPPTICTQWVTSKFWRLLLLHEASQKFHQNITLAQRSLLTVLSDVLSFLIVSNPHNLLWSTKVKYIWFNLHMTFSNPFIQNKMKGLCTIVVYLSTLSHF